MVELRRPAGRGRAARRQHHHVPDQPDLHAQRQPRRHGRLDPRGSERSIDHVPDMRAQYGSLYPASYYRLKEAATSSRPRSSARTRRARRTSQLRRRPTSTPISPAVGGRATPGGRTRGHAGDRRSAGEDRGGQDLDAHEPAKRGEEEGAEEQGEKRQAEIKSKIDEPRRDGCARARHSPTGSSAWRTSRPRRASATSSTPTCGTATAGSAREEQSFAGTIEHSIGARDRARAAASAASPTRRIAAFKFSSCRSSAREAR